MKVQVIGHTGRGRGSGLIRWATRGRFAHISLRFIFESKEEMLRMTDMLNIQFTMDHEIESIQGLGVHHQPFVPSDNQGWFDFKQSPHQSLQILAAAVKLIGKKYDWRGIFGFATRRNKQNPNKWFCSELAAHCLTCARIRCMIMPAHWITPNVMAASPIFTEGQNSEE